MKRIGLFFVAFMLILSACNSNKVKIRGDVKGLKGTVKLLAEIPGSEALAILDQQEVLDGKIELVTDSLVLPGRVWVDIDGKRTIETIVDSKDQIWIEGKIKFPDQIEVKGSGLDVEYNKLKKQFKEKYEGPIESIDKKLQKYMEKEKLSTNDQMMMSIMQMKRIRHIRTRANWVKNLIEANPTLELSLFLLKDELRDSLDLQKRLFSKMNVPNKESNIYKNIEADLK
jgi:hypothetical protein